MIDEASRRTVERLAFEPLLVPANVLDAREANCESAATHARAKHERALEVLSSLSVELVAPTRCDLVRLELHDHRTVASSKSKSMTSKGGHSLFWFDPSIRNV